MEFSILTNGRTINIYDKSFKAIKDIPETAISEEDDSIIVIGVLTQIIKNN